MSKKFSWYYNRLKAMSIKEVNYRIKMHITHKSNKLKYNTDVNIINFNKINLNYSIDGLNKLNKNINQLIDLNIINSIDDINIDNYEFYGDFINIKSNLNWFKGSKGNEWESNVYAKDIDFKGRDNIGEIRYTWEINRMQFLPQIAVLYKTTQEDNYLELLKTHFYDWTEKNNYLKGVNWSSPMEIAIRAYQWIIVYSIIKDHANTDDFIKDILKGIIVSCDYVMKNLSKYSSANNHLILEAAICSIIGYIISPVYKQKWFENGYNILNMEIPRQVYEDGVNKEQAVHYHAFVLDMMLQYNFFLKRIGKNAIFETYIYKMAQFLGSLQRGADITEFGDSDDAKIVNISVGNYYNYVLQLASLYYNIRFLAVSNNTIEKQAELFAFKSIAELNKDVNYEDFDSYEKGGYTIINKKGVFLLYDYGDLGFGSLAAHGHADALSFVLHFNNKPIFIDPGTYIYNIESYWRDYFRKSINHNTLSEGEIDQSKFTGPFIWSKKAKARLIEKGNSESLIYIFAEHDGYLPNIHKRAITFMVDKQTIIIADYFTEKAQINFIFNKSSYIKQIDRNLLYINNELYFSSSEQYKLVEKYMSNKFMKKVKTKGLLIEKDFSKKNVHLTIISPHLIKINDDNSFTLNNERYLYKDYKNILRG
ncbi:alginate lyase family protein [Metabacillus niabensis]|uniref:alginate lyase family protein n=1 Tax=Metabacillus niabensis TaxID=324854 RepID=UPI0039A14235